jgi:hypothetical protein
MGYMHENHRLLVLRPCGSLVRILFDRPPVQMPDPIPHVILLPVDTILGQVDVLEQADTGQRRDGEVGQVDVAGNARRGGFRIPGRRVVR